MANNGHWESVSLAWWPILAAKRVMHSLNDQYRPLRGCITLLRADVSHRKSLLFSWWPILAIKRALYSLDGQYWPSRGHYTLLMANIGHWESFLSPDESVYHLILVIEWMWCSSLDGQMLAMERFCISMVPLRVLCVFFIMSTLQEEEVTPSVKIQYLSCDTP
jgi:hypothetical protein